MRKSRFSGRVGRPPGSAVVAACVFWPFLRDCACPNSLVDLEFAWGAFRGLSLEVRIGPSVAIAIRLGISGSTAWGACWPCLASLEVSGVCLCGLALVRSVQVGLAWSCVAW